MKPSHKLTVTVLLFACCHTASAQSLSVSTNAAEWATLCTMNVGLGFAPAQHWSAHAAVCFNPFSFGIAEENERYEDIVSEERKAFQYKRESVAVGVRYWPWHVFSGWWYMGMAQLQSYDRGGLFRKERRQGTAVGAGGGIGYSLMLAGNWNLDFGVSGWLGVTKETVFERVNSNRAVEEVTRFFILPDEVILSLVYVF